MSQTHGAHLCLTQRADQTVGVDACNHSPAQQMAFASDFSIKNAAGDCMTVLEPLMQNAAFFGYRPMKFLPCIDSVTQHFGYTGTAPGNEFTGEIWYGAAEIGIYKVK